MLTVVTSFSPQGYEQYGQAFISSFLNCWPTPAKLICYTERMSIEGIQCVDLFSIEPAASFLFRHAGNPVTQGKMEGPFSRWGPKARAQGYSFRHDAYKFCRKVFAVCHAAKRRKGKLFWVDADVVTNTRVTRRFLDDVLPSKVSLAYLARPGYHTESGFVGYNLDHPDTSAFLNAYEWQYSSDVFMADTHWDDCNQFDYLVKKLAPRTKPIEHKSRAQPFEHSALGNYMTHYKGGRKA